MRRTVERERKMERKEKKREGDRGYFSTEMEVYRCKKT